MSQYARDLAGVPDDADNGSYPSQGDGTPINPSTTSRGPAARVRGTSPSPIRSAGLGGTPARHPDMSGEAVPPSEPRSLDPLTAHASSGPLLPSPPDVSVPRRESLALPVSSTAAATAAPTTVEVPNLGRDLGVPADSMAATTPLQSPHMRPKKLAFQQEHLASGHHHSREDTDESSAPMTRVSSSVAASTHGSRGQRRSRRPEGTATLMRDGKLQVRVVRDGKETIEEMEPNELAHLYAQQQAALQQMQGQFDFLTVPDWVRLHPMLGPYLAEATGTFAWVLTLSLASIRNRSVFNKADDTNVTCLPIGFMFTSMVFTFGYISGGHFNPAISLAVFLIRKMDLAQCLGYIICQIAAAFGAGVVAMLIQGNANIFVPAVESSFVTSGIFAELIYTFAVALVVLNTGYSRQSGNFFYGFAIGMIIAAGSASVGHISGGAFNPAAATGLQLAKCMTGACEDLKSFWIYWLAPVVGAVVAALIYSQMYQPPNTQVLQDHKVLRDPAKALMKGQREGDGSSESDNELTRSRNGERGSHSSSTSQSESSDVDIDVAGGGGSHHHRQRRGVDGSGSDDVEMSDIRQGRAAGGGGTAVLNDSLTEPVVPSRPTGYAKAKDMTSLV